MSQDRKRKKLRRREVREQRKGAKLRKGAVQIGKHALEHPLIH